MMTKRFAYLLKCYFRNTITEIEKQEMAAIAAQLDDEELDLQLEQAWHNYSSSEAMPEKIQKEIIDSILKETTDDTKHHPAPIIPIRKKTSFPKIAIAAASVVIIIAAGYLTMMHERKTAVAQKQETTPRLLEDVKAGGQKALLTLADGSQVVLDSASNGILAQQGNSQVIKKGDGSIEYALKKGTGTNIVYNSIATPAGGIYQLRLPDGTIAWLNSSSSIRYPTEFVSAQRNVEISGEVYFEVAKDAAKPFNVKIDEQTEVKVLGTHFNVNAYNDEAAIKTTLLEGSVNVTRGKNKCLLTPGQQAKIDSRGDITKVKDADAEEAVAWKNGFFLFNSASLPEILKQVGRWYDLTIVYEGKIPEDKFSGRVSRNVNLANFLKWMQWSDVHFRLENNNLIIKS